MSDKPRDPAEVATEQTHIINDSAMALTKRITRFIEDTQSGHNGDGDAIDLITIIREAFAEQRAELERLRAVIKPFAVVANGIPDNWPGKCRLRIDSGPSIPSRCSRRYEWVAYHGVGDDGMPDCDGLLPTIAEWHKAAEAVGGKQ